MEMLNITDSEFEREVEALKSHRRISVNRPLMDPDLPDLAAAHGGGREIMGSEAAGTPGSAGVGGERGGVDLTDEGPLLASSSSGRAARSSGARQAFTARRRGAGSASASAGAEDGASSSEASSSRAARNAAVPVHDEDTPLSRPTDPAHLFWVPASMHPEISPSDFRKFLQEHASRAAKDHTPPESGSSSPVSPTSATFAGAAGGPQSSYPFAARSGAAGPTPPQSPIDLVSRNTSIARRGSTLRRQYRPENDNDDSDGGRAGASSASIVRGGSARRGGPPPLSLEDLHKLEQLAEEASKSQDPSQLRSVLRRTLSLSTAPSALDQVDAVPAAEAEDAPLIVPRPGQILRRAARTKIRKASLSGENGGVRPPGRRRGGGSTGPEEIAAAAAGAQQQPLTDMAAVARALMERRSSKESEVSSGDDDGTTGSSSRPISDEATESIVDAYSRDSFISEASQRTSVTSLADSLQDGSGSGSGDSASSPHTAKHSEGRANSRSPSPPVTPTQTSLKSGRSGSDYFDEQREAALKQQAQQLQEQTPQPEARPVPTSQPLNEPLSLSLSGAPVTESPAHSPVDEPSSAERERAYPAIRPVAVSHVPPVPSFEKARAAPQPPQTAPPAQPSPVYAPPAQQASKREQPLQPPPSAPAIKPTASRESLPQAVQRPGKEKKSGFASWFGIGKEDDEAEKQAKARKRERKEREAMEQEQRMEREQRERESMKEREKEREREKDKDSSSFLGALFGSKKKGGDDTSLNQHQMGMRSADSHITAGSLLDRSSGGRGPHANYYRYPIHIERAVYRLSHIKLANPRRPLYEQVLISNLMFWYLSIINRSQQQQQQQLLQQQMAQQQQQQQQQQAQQQQQQQQQTQQAQPQQAQQNAVPPLQMLQPSPQLVPQPQSHSSDDHGRHLGALSDSAAQAEAPAHAEHERPQSKTKRAGLVKPNRAPPGSRSAEMAIPAAAYGAQHRQINNDLAMQQHQANHGSSTPAASHVAQTVPVTPPPTFAVGQVVDPRALSVHTGYQGPQSNPGPNGRLPPGAMSPSGSSRSTSPGYDASGAVSPSSSGQRAYSPSGAPASHESRSTSSGAWLGSSSNSAGGGGGSSGGGRTSPGVGQTGGSRRSPSGSQSAADEHSWLGSASSTRSGSRSPHGERTSDPMSQAWRVDGGPWLGSEEMGARRSTRSSDPTGSDGFYASGSAASYRSDAAPNGYGHRHDSRSLDAGDGRERKGSGDDGSRPIPASGETSSYTTSSHEPPSAAARPRIKTATSRSGSSEPSTSPSAPLRTSSPPAISLAGSSAMLEAARSSQSRRR